MLTVNDYRSALRVLGELSLPLTQLDELRELAEKAEAREQYADALGKSIAAKATCSPHYLGAYVINKLLGDGWKPPEGLF